MKHNLLLISSVGLIIVLMLLTIFGSRWYNKKHTGPATLGLARGQLTECNKSPNCVSSQTSQASKSVDSFVTKGHANATWLKLKAVIEVMPQASLVKEFENYRHYEFTTALMGFIDDFKLLFDVEDQLIHVKSAPRVGHSDMGTNLSVSSYCAKSLSNKRCYETIHKS